MVGPWLEDGGGVGEEVGEERLAEEAGIPAAALRVQDPELRPPPRRTGSVPGDDYLRPLADDVPAEPDPRPLGQLQPEPGRLGDRARDRAGEARRLEDDEKDGGSASQRREPAQPVRDRGRPPAIAPGANPTGEARGGSVRASPIARQVDDEEVHRAARDERPGHRQRLVQGGRLKDDEPFETDPSGDRLDRVEAPGQIDVGNDRAGGLGFGRKPQGEGGLAARGLPPDGQGGRARDPTRAEDGIQRGEPRPDDPLVVDRPGRTAVGLVGEWDRGERTDDRPGPAERLPTDPWRGLPPTRPEGRQGRRHVRGESRHRTAHDRTDVLSRQERNARSAGR
jgi:hypothetical protein